MKQLRNLLAAVALCLAATLTPATGQEQYGLKDTLVNLPVISWATGSATNFAAATSVPKWQEFVLVVRAGQADTAGAAGTLDLRWDTSADGSTYVNGAAFPGASGWFNIPLTNSGAVITWQTNITVNSIGYWRMNYLTNASGKTLTNVLIRTYVKPARWGGFGP